MNIRKIKTCKFIFIILFVVICSLQFSCKKEDVKPMVNIVNDQFPDDFKGYIKDKKIYITSIGQDAEMIKFQITTLEKQELFEYTIDSFLDADNVTSNSVVFIFVGCSIKALGESGVTLNDEMKRADAFIKKCQNNEISIIALHTGGVERRGSTSDQFISKIFSNSNLNIYVDKGNFDNMLSDISYRSNIPAYQISSLTALSDTLKMLYGDVQ